MAGSEFRGWGLLGGGRSLALMVGVGWWWRFGFGFGLGFAGLGVEVGIVGDGDKDGERAREGHKNVSDESASIRCSEVYLVLDGLGVDEVGRLLGQNQVREMLLAV